MITLRKLRQLPPATRLRKIVRLLDGFVQYRSCPDERYLNGLVELIHEQDQTDIATNAYGDGIAGGSRPDVLHPPAGTDREAVLRYVDDLRYELRSRLDIPVGDWDLLPPAGYGRTGQDGEISGHQGSFLMSRAGAVRAVYLESIRSPFNAGSIIRTAVALGVTRIGMSPDCPPVDHRRLVRTARGAQSSVPIVRRSLSEIDDDWRPFIALEVAGRPVDTYRFPESGTLLVGSEELGLTSTALGLAEATVSVRMTDVKGSMNVGVACGIALHTWNVQARMTDPGD